MPRNTGIFRSRLLLNQVQAAYAMGICRETLRQMIYRGEIPVVKIRGRGQHGMIRIPIDGLRRWIKAASRDEF
jgi:excisionase family DNA binding protein